MKFLNIDSILIVIGLVAIFAIGQYNNSLSKQHTVNTSFSSGNIIFSLPKSSFTLKEINNSSTQWTVQLSDNTSNYLIGLVFNASDNNYKVLKPICTLFKNGATLNEIISNNQIQQIENQLQISIKNNSIELEFPFELSKEYHNFFSEIKYPNNSYSNFNGTLRKG